MAQSPYSIENVYRDINKIDNYFYETKYSFGPKIQSENKIINKYCHYGNTPGKCHDYYQRASSGVIYLLKTLKDNYDFEYDKLAEYAILWLRYKLNRTDPYHKIKLNDFYTNHIETNKDYNKKIKDNDLTYKEIINKKRDLMDIKEINNFSYPFSILIYLYNANNANKLNCKNYSNSASEFATRFKQLNNDPNNIEGSSYNKILSTISNDYDNLKKKCKNFSSLPELTPKKSPVASPAASSVDNPVDKSVKGSKQNSLESSEKVSVQHTALIPEVTSSSSSISTTLIPALSIVSIIPVFLGIAYKTIYKKKIKKNNEENEN
ncbi:PIR protein CIR protein [Plasmodium vinckei petteri]|uniref:PIR protein CIR protein n=1 Tax=Plasmodium vinckei petteri TaxID=138298 RepID=A0A6V7SD36_PLAVN|nr:PIR protein CIR protein [Plasmodium vinckei petteri]